MLGGNRDRVVLMAHYTNRETETQIKTESAKVLLLVTKSEPEPGPLNSA